MTLTYEATIELMVEDMVSRWFNGAIDIRPDGVEIVAAIYDEEIDTVLDDAMKEYTAMLQRNYNKGTE